jgi:hypothetical protein
LTGRLHACDRPFRVPVHHLFDVPGPRGDKAMKRFLCILLCACLAVGLCGCGGDKERGTNKDKDKPRASDK